MKAASRISTVSGSAASRSSCSGTSRAPRPMANDAPQDLRAPRSMGSDPVGSDPLGSDPLGSDPERWMAHEREKHYMERAGTERWERVKPFSTPGHDDVAQAAQLVHDFGMV